MREEASPIERKATIKGKAFSKRGNPLGGVGVECDGREATTICDGTFEIVDVEAGAHVLTARLKGFETRDVNINLNMGDEVFVELVLMDAEGDGMIYGYAYDSDNHTPITSGGTVILVLPASNRYARLDSQGRYEFKNLPPDTYSIRTSIPGYQDVSVQVKVEEGEAKRHDLYCNRVEVEEVPWG